jgi:hypothetical protein
MTRTQEQIREALENSTVASREAAAAVISDAAKSKPENKEERGNRLPGRVSGSSGT